MIRLVDLCPHHSAQRQRGVPWWAAGRSREFTRHRTISALGSAASWAMGGRLTSTWLVCLVPSMHRAPEEEGTARGQWGIERPRVSRWKAGGHASSRLSMAMIQAWSPHVWPPRQVLRCMGRVSTPNWGSLPGAAVEQASGIKASNSRSTPGRQRDTLNAGKSTRFRVMHGSESTFQRKRNKKNGLTETQRNV